MRGLLAIEPLYRQIVSGKKTQTRRSGGLELVNAAPEDWKIVAAAQQQDGTTGSKGALYVTFKRIDSETAELCHSRYNVGEVLYLKEPYKTVDAPVYIEYAFDKPRRTYESGVLSDFKGMGYENKLFMPAGFARQFVRITGIKCERLFDISDEDCVAEGIMDYSPNGNLFGYYNYLSRDYASHDIWELSAHESFISLYKLANKMKWNHEIENIWVWVYSFEYLPEQKI